MLIFTEIGQSVTLSPVPLASETLSDLGKSTARKVRNMARKCLTFLLTVLLGGSHELADN